LGQRTFTPWQPGLAAGPGVRAFEAAGADGLGRTICTNLGSSEFGSVTRTNAYCMLEVVTDVVDDGRVQAGRDGTVNRFAYAAAAHRAGERDKGLTSVDSPAIAELVGDLFKPTIAVGLDLEVVAALSVGAAGGGQAVRKKRRQASPAEPSHLPAGCRPTG